MATRRWDGAAGMGMAPAGRGRRWGKMGRLARIVTLAIVLGVAGAAGFGLPAAAQTDTGVCGSFATQEEAQAAFDAGELDPALTDYDGNGVACEGLPSASAPAAGDGEPADGEGEIPSGVTALPSTGTGGTGGTPIAPSGALSLAAVLLASVAATGLHLRVAR